VFVDDVNIHSLNWKEHLQHIQMVLQQLRKVSLKLNLSECYFGAQNITFIRHVVNIEGSYLDPKKIDVVESFLILKIMTNVKAFLGLIGYYRKFIYGYSRITKPLFGLTKKDSKFLWTPICQGTFVTLKKCLVASLILTRPDFSQPFILDIDWSIRGVGTILLQKIERHD